MSITAAGMNKELINRCNLLVRNRDALHDVFKWNNSMMTLAGSSFYVELNVEADPEKLHESEQILRKKTGVFSDYRSYIKMPLLCKMAVSADPENYYNDIRCLVARMKHLKWINANYKILAAMTIYDHVHPTGYIDAIEKMSDLYQSMKSNHPWIISGDDLAFAAMIASSGVNDRAALLETESCYQELKDHFPDKAAVQALSHVLAFSKTETIEKCHMVEELFNLLKVRKHRYGTGNELPMLGAFCMLDLPVDTIADEIIQADEYLKRQKGFSGFSMSDKTRRMYAALMVMDTHMPETSIGHDSLLDGMLAMAIATEMEIYLLLMMGAASSCCAAANY